MSDGDPVVHDARVVDAVDPDQLAADVLGRQRRALAKAITLIEGSRPDQQRASERLLERILPHTGQAIRVGISGVPGVGKSTFIEALGLERIAQGSRVAVLAVDPTSRISGGSILGDKTRMPRLSAAEQSFIRPSPSGGTLGGVAHRTREAVLLCEAAGYDVVLVETVGVGQSEHAVASMVDTFLLLALAGAGDELQGIKRGILELIDVLCVTKADGDNEARAKRAAAEHRSALHLLRGADRGWSPPVLTASALTGAGVAQVWEAVIAHRAHLEQAGQLAQRRAQQRLDWLETLVTEELTRAFWRRSEVKAEHAALRRQLADDRISVTQAARRLLALAGLGDGD